MAIISEQSVGSITYQLIDDWFPLHSSKTGTVAINTNGDIFTCIGGYEWSMHIKDKISGEMAAYSPNDTNSYTVNQWVNLDALTWTAGTLNNFSFSGSNRMVLSYDNVGVFLLNGTFSSFVLSNNQVGRFEAGAARSNAVPYRYNGGVYNPNQNFTSSLTTHSIFSMDSRNTAFMNMAHRAIGATAGNHCRYIAKASISIIDEPVAFYEYGKSSAFTTNNWVTVNDTTNRWFMGGATTFSGGGTSMYISTGQTTNVYNNAVAQVSHVYKDFTFPVNMTSDAFLSFYWKSNGEVNDYCRVYFGPASAITPTSGVVLSNTYAVGVPYSGTTTYSNVSNLTVGARTSITGTTQRLVFSWINNSGVGTNPPISLDSIRLHFYP